MPLMGGSGPNHDAAPNNDALTTALGTRKRYSWMGPAAAPIKPPRAPLANTPTTPTTIAPAAHRSTPTSRPASAASAAQHAIYYNPLSFVSSLEAYMATLPNAPAYYFDFKRLRVLLDALKAKDFAYLTMHQYYTLHTYATTYTPATIPRVFQQQPDLPAAFEMMRFVLKGNDQFSHQTLHFCATFPHPIGDLRVVWPLAFEQESRNFFALAKRAAHFPNLITECDARGFGPLAHELVHNLAIVSPTFQLLIFTAISRRVNNLILSDPLHTHLEDQLLAVFRQNQANCANMTAYHPDWHKDPRRRDTERQIWGTRLRGVTALLPTQQSVSRHVPAPTFAHTAQAATQRAHAQGFVRSVPASHTPVPVPPLPSPVQPSRRTPLLPRPGWNLPQQRVCMPGRFALHQANLRSPILLAQVVSSRLYHCWEDFLLTPKQLLDADRDVARWTFIPPSELLRKMAAEIPVAPGTCESRAVTEQSKTFRLRCVKWTASQLPQNSVWATLDTSWIPYSYFTLNGTTLQQRKKKHHGKDRPIEITGLLKEGDNILEVAVMSQSNDTTYRNYLVAIEVLGIMTHSSIQEQCRTNMRSKDTCLNEIKAKLSGAEDGDDEITVVESSLTISLCDPFSGSLITGVPVRSTACLHHDCFDLDTFLETRPRKGDASKSDHWRCPVCNVDARPSLLFVDGFFEDVRAQLSQQGLSHTRAITVDQHGAWKPKAEVRDPNGVQEDVTPDAESPAVFVPPAHVEIIDLDD